MEEEGANCCALISEVNHALALKVCLVVNKVDMVTSEEDRARVLAFVRQQAKEGSCRSPIEQLDDDRPIVQCEYD